MSNNLIFFKSKWEECAVSPFCSHFTNFVINLWIAVTLDLLCTHKQSFYLQMVVHR